MRLKGFQKSSFNVVFIGLGSNVGNRRKNIERAMRELERSGQEILKLSSVYETEPWGYKKQRKFLNAALKIRTTLSPHQLLKLCKDIEKKLGRKKSFRWGPRLIDLDILLYGKRRVNDKKLKIPHPEMHKREFVLKPLLEVLGERSIA